MDGLLVFVVILLLAFCWKSRAWMNEERTSWSSEKFNNTLSEETLKRQIQNFTVKQNENLLQIRRLRKYIDELQYAYDPSLTKTFELEPAESRAAVSLTLIDDKLLIANSINGDLKVLDAHSLTKESNWATIPLYSVAGMGLCRKNGQVFVSTWNKNIFIFDKNGQKLGKWPVETVASGVISVTDDCNVVLAVRDNSKKILTYSTYGEIISEVEMKADILKSLLIKAVQISNGHFLVSYGEGDDPMHGIDIINANGQTIKSYGKRKGAGIGQLSDPRDFVVDGMGNVLVADSGNGRILLLDSGLNFQRELVSMEHGLQHPFGILLNEFGNLLYVVDNQWKPTKKKWTDGRIMVFKIK